MNDNARVTKYLVRADERLPNRLSQPLVIEIDDEGAAVLCAQNEPVFATDRLSTLLTILGVDDSVLQPVG